LGVAYILEGSVQRYEDNIRIIVQLIDAKNDEHVWTNTYDRKLQDVFAIQSEISRQIANSLNTVLSPGEIEQIEKEPTDNLAAYDLYQRGRYFWHLRSEEDLQKSITYFNRALELDSNYALAYSGLADTYFIITWRGWLPKEEGYEKSRALAEKALSLDPKLSQAYATIGGILKENGKFDDAEKVFKTALELDPGYATGHQYYSELLQAMRRFGEAEKELDLALTYNPLSVTMRFQRSWLKYHQGYYSAALNDIVFINEMEPTASWLPFYCHYHIGHFDKALKDVQRIVSIESSNSIDTLAIRSIYSAYGMDGVLRWLIDYHSDRAQPEHLIIARNYMLLEEPDKAIDWLEHGFDNQDRWVTSVIHYSNDFKPLHGRPRYMALLEKMKQAEQQ
jgi:tetratricopeptide (TPR) repeat protein